MTGFEPATLRPPDVYATRLRHIPIDIVLMPCGKVLTDCCPAQHSIHPLAKIVAFEFERAKITKFYACANTFFFLFS